MSRQTVNEARGVEFVQALPKRAWARFLRTTASPNSNSSVKQRSGQGRTGRGVEVALALLNSEGAGDATASQTEQFAEVERVYLNSLVPTGEDASLVVETQEKK